MNFSSQKNIITQVCMLALGIVIMTFIYQCRGEKKNETNKIVFVEKDHLKKIQDYYNNRQFEKVIQLLESNKELSNNQYLEFYLADSYLKLGQYEKAIQYLESLNQVDSLDKPYESMKSLTNYYLNKSQKEQSIQILQRYLDSLIIKKKLTQKLLKEVDN